MADLEHLAWDSDFFGFRVARITRPRLTPEELRQLLDELRAAAVRLVYWPAANEAELRERGAQLGGILVDEKTRFVADLPGQIELPEKSAVKLYIASEVSPELEQLAIASGAQSRFRVDPRLPPERCDHLYRRWIERSVSREIADAVLVWHSDAGKLGGMITAGHHAGRGQIGLLAVDAAYRGQGIGGQLIAAAHQEFIRRGYHSAEVVTQGANGAACRLYQRCGYRVEQVELFFHFWLDAA
jgi:dTDP-4-amino-4,6-dideoxy-D-galactose acyltransferase